MLLRPWKRWYRGKRLKDIYEFMAVIGMDIIVGDGTHIPVNQIRRIGDRRFKEHSNGIRSILLN